MDSCVELKLVALDKDDMEVVSAHVQDAMVKVGDIFWKPREHRFVMAMNRFDWISAVEAKPDSKADYRRCRTALRFERVLACKIPQSRSDRQGHAAQSARRRIRRNGFSGRNHHADLFRRRRHSSRRRMSGSRACRSRRGHDSGSVPRPFRPRRQPSLSFERRHAGRGCCCDGCTGAENSFISKMMTASVAA